MTKGNPSLQASLVLAAAAFTSTTLPAQAQTHGGDSCGVRRARRRALPSRLRMGPYLTRSGSLQIRMGAWNPRAVRAQGRARMGARMGARMLRVRALDAVSGRVLASQRLNLASGKGEVLRFDDLPQVDMLAIEANVESVGKTGQSDGQPLRISLSVKDDNIVLENASFEAWPAKWKGVEKIKLPDDKYDQPMVGK